MTYTPHPKIHCRERHQGYTCGRIRLVVNKLLDKGYSPPNGKDGDFYGTQTRLAEYFHVTRQRVCQIVKEEMTARALLSLDNT